METAKLFTNGKSQAVRLPKECRFSGSEVGISKIGEMVVLYPKDKAWDIFISSEPATDDFCDAILAARKNDSQTEREQL